MIGERIAIVRNAHNETQTQLAESIGVSRINITRYENGTRCVPISVVINICRHYNISSDYLLGLDCDDCTETKTANVMLRNSITRFYDMISKNVASWVKEELDESAS